MLVWACTENGRKQNYQKSIIYKFGNKTVVRPVATYGSETWTLTKSDENSLRIFERKILRKIYGPVQEGDTWRIRQKKKLSRLIKGKDGWQEKVHTRDERKKLRTAGNRHSAHANGVKE
jgi:hypothetical protein